MSVRINGKSDLLQSCVRAGEAKLRAHVREILFSTLGMWIKSCPSNLISKNVVGTCVFILRILVC